MVLILTASFNKQILASSRNRAPLVQKDIHVYQIRMFPLPWKLNSCYHLILSRAHLFRIPCRNSQHSVNQPKDLAVLVNFKLEFHYFIMHATMCIMPCQFQPFNQQVRNTIKITALLLTYNTIYKAIAYFKDTVKQKLLFWYGWLFILQVLLLISRTTKRNILYRFGIRGQGSFSPFTMFLFIYIFL